ncbi:MAG: response regulator transcription factor [Bacilli bacterium]|jgi:two-component system alkaline phosphatase synthesis response regulator PhoP|nr:response regulator transcription factor [Bacilli bacterium]
MSKILIADTSDELKKGLEYDFKQQGYKVVLTNDGINALNLIKNETFDMIVLDIELPNLNGIELIERIRSIDHRIRIIVLTTKDDEMDIVLGLENGANDYITKPFSPRVLLARVKANLRDISKKEYPKQIVINENLSLDNNTRNATLDGTNISLSKLEFDLLSYFINNSNRVIGRDELMKSVWKNDFDSKNRIIDVYVHALRNKLNLIEQLQSKRGVGYIFKNNLNK